MAVAAAVTPPVPAPRPNAWQTALLAIPAMATVVGLAGVVRFLFWTSGRGFDITDEGYYFIGARHPADAVISVTSSQYELSLLFAAVRWNIPLYRVVGFCITVVAAFVLAAGLDAWRRRMSPGGSRSWTYLAAEAGAIAAGSLLGNSWLLTSPSYNTVTNWGLSLGAGAVLVTLAIGDANRVASIWLGVMGLALGATFFAKFTAALAVGAVFMAVLLAWPLVPFRTRVRWLLPAASGFALFAAFHFIVFQSPVAWVRTFRLGVWAASTQSPLHTAGAGTRYVVEWRDDVLAFWLKEFGRVFYVLTGIAAVMLFVPIRRRAGIVVRVVAWAAVGYAGYLATIHVRDYPPVLYAYDVTRFFFGWLLLLGPLALVWGGRMTLVGQRAEGLDEGGRRVVLAWSLVVVMLFLLPFCGAIGTGNPLHFGMRYTLAPWFALFAIILGRLSAPARTRWAVPIGLACLSACCAVYLVKGPLEAPYRLLTELRGQTEDTQIGEPGSIVKLDPELHAFITGVRKAALDNGFKPGDDMLGLFDMPGMVYALGARSPVLPWWINGYPGSRVVMERAVELAGAERLRHAYILQTELSTEWLQSLKSRGVNFPDDYVLAGTFTIPYAWAKYEARLWRPKAR